MKQAPNVVCTSAEFCTPRPQTQNILLTAKRGGIAKVSDFGLAKNFQEAGLSGMTATGTVAGTLAFMPREQPIDFKPYKPVSDVWSMGATLYYMLTEKTPRDYSCDRNQVEIIMRDEIIGKGLE